MNSHQASEQMLGYLYQVRYALALLLEKSNRNFQVLIEKFDDISFSDEGKSKELIQLKHHSKSGSLTDASVDLWRTLNVWLDYIDNNVDLLVDSNFYIITTAVAPKESIAFYLKENKDRDTDIAYKKLLEISNTSSNKENKKYYDAFLNTSQTYVKELVNRIYIIDSACNIVDTDALIRKHIRYACTPKYEDQVCERLEGWWYRKTIEALSSETPKFISQNQVRSFIVSVVQEYCDDNLPIDAVDCFNVKENNLGVSERIFYEQLSIIGVGKERVRFAIRDYYRASTQRASWIRNQLLATDELDKYEKHLVEEWEREFSIMQDDIDNEIGVTENEKMKHGRELLINIENKDIRIRPRCSETFVMRGSYHILANQLKVGWHIDYKNRIKKILDSK